MIVEQALTVAEQTACSTLERLLRPYVPEQYPITVSLLDKLNVYVIVGNMNGAHIVLNTNHHADNIVWWISVSAAGHHNIGRSIRQQHLYIDDLAPNFATVLQLLEDGYLHAALTALTQQQSKGNIKL